jgi:predicted transcriptional regulator
MTIGCHIFMTNMLKSSLPILIELFETLGLSKELAQIYHTCYLYPHSPVQKIAEIAGIKRTTMYTYIKKLIEAGLVSEVEDGWKKGLVAKDLDFLQKSIESKTLEADRLLKAEMVGHDEEKNKLQLYRDIPSIKESYYRLLKQIPTTQYYYINGNILDWYNLDRAFFRKFITERDGLCRENRLRIQAILDGGLAEMDDKKRLNYQKFYQGIEHLDYKILEDITYRSNTIITQGLMLIHTIPDNQIITTSNPYLIESYRYNFESLWDRL